MDSGQNIAQIQTAWHNYYQSLDDADKRQVWQEFYSNHKRGSAYFSRTNSSQKVPESPVEPPKKQQHSHRPTKPIIKTLKNKVQETSPATVGALKKYLLDTVVARGTLEKKHHIKSLLFGVGMGLFVVLILMFGLFNERFIVPFITPSKNITSTPIIVDPLPTAPWVQNRLLSSQNQS